MSEKLHYSLIEWRTYKDGLVDDNKIEEMQNHLLKCDECMELYLSLMEDFASEAKPDLVPECFVQNVMDSVHGENRKSLMQRRRAARSRLITYYVSAACVTLILVSSGVFTSMFNSYTKFDTQISTISSKTENIFTSGWTDRIVDRTSRILDISVNK